MFEIAFLQIRQPRIQKPRRMVIREGENPFQTLRSTWSLHTHIQPENAAVSEVWLCSVWWRWWCWWGCWCSVLAVVWWGGRGAALPEGLPLLRVWRSTSNLFAVIAVRANTLESSNSLFYFSHHEGDHLSSRPPARLHFQPSQPLASGPLPPAARNMSSHRRVCTQRHKPSMATFFFIFLQVALMHHTFTQPGTAWQRQRTWAREGEIFFLFLFTRCWWQ